MVCLNDPGSVTGYSARFSPDSRRIALAHLDGELLVYDLATHRASRLRRGPGPAQISPIGRTEPRSRLFTLRNHRPARSLKRTQESLSGRLCCRPWQRVSPGAPTVPCWRRRARIARSISGTLPPVSGGRPSKAHQLWLACGLPSCRNIAGQQRLGRAAPALGSGPGQAGAERDKQPLA